MGCEMKDYKRLTERDDSLCIDCADIGFCRKTCIRQARYERLQFLENKIESGEIDYVSDRDKEIVCLTAERDDYKSRAEVAEQKATAWTDCANKWKKYYKEQAEREIEEGKKDE